jgi:hypothetical protein
MREGGRRSPCGRVAQHNGDEATARARRNRTWTRLGRLHALGTTSIGEGVCSPGLHTMGARPASTHRRARCEGHKTRMSINGKVKGRQILPWSRVQTVDTDGGSAELQCAGSSARWLR